MGCSDQPRRGVSRPHRRDGRVAKATLSLAVGAASFVICAELEADGGFTAFGFIRPFWNRLGNRQQARIMVVVLATISSEFIRLLPRTQPRQNRRSQAPRDFQANPQTGLKLALANYQFLFDGAFHG